MILNPSLRSALKSGSCDLLNPNNSVISLQFIVVVSQEAEVNLRYPVDELYYPIIFSYTLLGQRQLLLVQEYHVDANSRAVGEVVIRPMGHGVKLALTDTARCAADVALFYYCLLYTSPSPRDS